MNDIARASYALVQALVAAGVSVTDRFYAATVYLDPEDFDRVWSKQAKTASAERQKGKVVRFTINGIRFSKRLRNPISAGKTG